MRALDLDTNLPKPTPPEILSDSPLEWQAASRFKKSSNSIPVTPRSITGSGIVGDRRPNDEARRCSARLRSPRVLQLLADLGRLLFQPRNTRQKTVPKRRDLPDFASAQGYLFAIYLPDRRYDAAMADSKKVAVGGSRPTNR